MKIKKKDLVESVKNLESTKVLALDGNIALSVNKLKKALLSQTEKFDEDRKDIMESFCAKNEDGSPKVEMRQAGSETYNYYDFGTPEKSEEAFKKVQELENEEVEIPVYKTVTESYFDNIKATPQQIEGLSLLIE